MPKVVLWIMLLQPILAVADENLSCPTQLRTFHAYDRSGQTLSCLDQWQTSFFNELGCPLRFVKGNPLTQIKEKMLQRQQVELLVGLSQSPYRPYQFSQPFAQHRYQFYRRSDDMRWQQLTHLCDESMRQANIIMPEQGYLGDDVEVLRADKNCSKSLLPAPPGYALSLDMLEKKRADLLLSSDLWLKRMPEQQASRYQALPFFTWHDQIGFAFSDGISSSFVQRVNRLIQHRIDQGLKVCDLDLPPPTTIDESNG